MCLKHRSPSYLYWWFSPQSAVLPRRSSRTHQSTLGARSKILRFRMSDRAKNWVWIAARVLYIKPYDKKKRDCRYAQKNCWPTKLAALHSHKNRTRQRSRVMQQTYSAVAWPPWRKPWTRNLYKTIVAKPIRHCFIVNVNFYLDVKTCGQISIISCLHIFDRCLPF